MEIKLLESFKFDNLTPEKKKALFSKFKDSYEKSIGTSWSMDKFYGRAHNWLFFGDENGYIAVRPQKSGFYKLVGVAGGIRSIYKGFDELEEMNVPVWGMMSEKIAEMLKKKGYKSPSRFLIKLIYKHIPKSVFGDVDFELNKNGSITLKYSDVGEATKFFVANKAYYRKLRTDILKKVFQIPEFIKKAIVSLLGQPDTANEKELVREFIKDELSNLRKVL